MKKGEFVYKLKFFILLILINTTLTELKGQKDTVKILFLGNSFTAVNSLPNIFEQLATAAGKIIVVADVSPGGFTLNNHTTNPSSISQIASQKWDFVVLQEQSQIPSIIPNRETLMFPYAILLDSIIHQSSICTQTTFFMTWGHKNGDLGLPVGSDTYESMQQRLRSGYLIIADSIDALVAPVGWAWRYVRQNYPSIELYSSDNYHPATTGTYLAACVFYASLFEQSPLGNGYDAGLDPSIAQNLQFAAEKIVLDSLTLWNHGVYNPNPMAHFTYQNLTSSNGVMFTSQSLNADSLFWDFGDSTISSLINPTHYYSSPGTYQVSLIAKNECNSDTIHQNITIIINNFEENLIKKTTLIYPNPTKNTLTIIFSGLYNAESIRLITVQGKTLKEINLEDLSKNNELDISNLDAGLYFLSVVYKNGKIENTKIIKQ
jgi:PKD repeat protein